MVKDSKNLNEHPFEVVTIAGYRYEVTLEEVFSWFTSRWWWIFAMITQVPLMAFMPHNKIYDLDWTARLVFWPLTTFFYVSIYLLCMYLGARYVIKHPDRQYYTPIGLLVPAILVTLVTAILIAGLRGEPPDLGIFKWMEMLFNLLWAAIYEAVFFAFILPLLRKSRESQTHRWESFD